MLDSVWQRDQTKTSQDEFSNIHSACSCSAMFCVHRLPSGSTNESWLTYLSTNIYLNWRSCTLLCNMLHQYQCLTCATWQLVYYGYNWYAI